MKNKYDLENISKEELQNMVNYLKENNATLTVLPELLIPLLETIKEETPTAHLTTITKQYVENMTDNSEPYTKGQFIVGLFGDEVDMGFNMDNYWLDFAKTAKPEAYCTTYLKKKATEIQEIIDTVIEEELGF